MNKKPFLFAAAMHLGFALACPATTHYVDANGANPTPPYLDWTTAATNIQDAIDASVAGDLVMVTNGVYAYGGRPVNGFALTNRVAMDIAVTMQSVNGASVTTILGNPFIGDSAVRCVYMTNGATLIGFTLANGATRAANAVDVFERDGGGAFCEANNIILSDCVLATNSASDSGGGVYQGTLINCTLVGNTAPSNSGGGAVSSILTNCVVIGNTAPYGAGVNTSSLNNCLLSGNQGTNGGGAINSDLDACIIQSNSVVSSGGGADGCTLNDCLLTMNAAGASGGGENQCTLTNCTLADNSAPTGGGAAGGTLYNSIVFDNYGSSGSNYSTGVALNYCCTAPLPSSGMSNITDPPLFVGNDDYHLQSNSLCINAGNNAYVVGGTDLDGNPRIVGGIVDIGAYEYQTPVPLSVAIQADNTNVAPGVSLPLQADINYGSPSSIIWDFGDGTSVTNQSDVSHAWTTPGLYTVTVTVSNAYTPGGATASVIIQAVANPVSYVNVNGVNPVAPYSSWDTAATNIQDAIEATSFGGLVLVTNGLYAVGGHTANGFALSNRVVVDHPLTLQSVNGPSVTTIQGYTPATTNGPSAIRCVFLTNNASLIGFTISGGATLAGGDIANELSGGGIWCPSSNAVVSNCLVVSNACFANGGGVYQGTLLDCTLANNLTINTGGGASASVLSNCVVSGNLALIAGGGANSGILYNCTVSGNNAGNGNPSFMPAGGGIASATVVNCLVYGNSAYLGGGVASGTIFNSAIFDNTAVNGGGASSSALVNCTVGWNNATFGGSATGGLYSGSATNCIIYFNTSKTPSFNNYQYPILDHCCTLPMPSTGTGNITNDPALASVQLISLNSPCRGAGTAAVTTGVDIDGGPWANPPSIGCDELYPGSLTNTPVVDIIATYTNVPAGYSDTFTANIAGGVDESVWDFGDGTRATNAPVISHIWPATGTYPVTLYAINDSYPSGLPEVVTINDYIPTTLYVSLSNKAPVAPYDSWAKAATNIQNAVDIAFTNGTVILVSNGLYNVGSRTNTDGSTNRVLVWQPVTLQSLNGPTVTRIDGGHAMRCVYLTNGAGLIGFTITNSSPILGGGIYSSSSNNLIANCLVISNVDALYQGTATNCTFVRNSGGYGTAATQSILEDCVVGPGNSSTVLMGCLVSNCLIASNLFCMSGSTVFNSLITSNTAGIAQQSTLVNCTITSNLTEGSGITLCNLTNCLLAWNSIYSQKYLISDSTAVNCTIVSNLGAATVTGGRFSAFQNCIDYYNFTNFVGIGGGFSNCCIWPLPPGPGIANFTNPPLFVNIAASDYHLQSTSPCINAGNNTAVSTTTDFDGNPRIQGGTVDVGAYEYQTPTSVISYAWLQQYGLPTDGSVDSADLDGTGFNVYQDWIAGLNPTNALSVLAMLPPAFTNSTGVSISWQSVSNETYYLERATDLGASPAFTLLQSNIVGQAGITTVIDTTATNSSTCFYRVGIQQPYANISN